MSTSLVPVADIERMAQAIAASKLFGTQNVEQAMALMLVAQAEGLHPATAARDYHIIQGRPALKADAMLARFLASGGKVEWAEHTDEKVAATFSHPAGGSLRIDWDMDRAKKAGLGGKDNWKKFPRQMLRARVISEGVRATNPGVVSGFYAPEEVQDFVPPHAPEKNMGPAVIVNDAPAKPKPAPVRETVDADTGEIKTSGPLPDHALDDVLPTAEQKLEYAAALKDNFAACENVEAVKALFGDLWKELPKGGWQRTTLKAAYDGRMEWFADETNLIKGA